MVVSRYLVREVLQSLVVVLVVLLLIFIGRHFARYLAEAAAGELPAELIFRMLAMLTINASVMLIPFAFFIAVLLALGRLYRDSEMTAFAAAGLSLTRVARPIFFLSLGLAGFVGWLAVYAAPWAARQSVEIREQAEAQSDLASIGAGQFREVGVDRSVFYVESLSNDRSVMNHVFVQRTTPDGMSLFAANSGYQYVDADSGDRYLVLLDGRRYEGTPGDSAFRIHDYAKASFRIEPLEVRARSPKQDSIATTDLLQSSDVRNTAELQRRLSMPLSLLLLGALAVYVSRTSPREGRYARLFGAILIYVIYNNLMGAALSWVQRGVVPTSVGIWWVHGSLLVAIIALVGKHYGWRYLLGGGAR